MRDAITLTRSGCFIDLDTAGEDVSEYLCFYFDNDAEPEQITLSSDAGQNSPANLLDQIRSARERRCIEFPRLLSLVTKNTAKVLRLQDKGELAAGKAADVLVLDADSLELKEVIAGGKRMLRNGRLEFKENYLEKSNRVINLVGAEA
jgi:beta-aspartyl-dipeptidase (metallo-type)